MYHHGADAIHGMCGMSLPNSDPSPPEPKPPGHRLMERIQHEINCGSAENGSNTPDWILAEYLIGCLAAFDHAVNARERYYGRPSDTAAFKGSDQDAQDRLSISSGPDPDYTLVVSKPDDDGRVYIQSPQIPGFHLYGLPREVMADVVNAVDLLDKHNGRRRQ